MKMTSNMRQPQHLLRPKNEDYSRENDLKNKDNPKNEDAIIKEDNKKIQRQLLI